MLNHQTRVVSAVVERVHVGAAKVRCVSAGEGRADPTTYLEELVEVRGLYIHPRHRFSLQPRLIEQ